MRRATRTTWVCGFLFLMGCGGADLALYPLGQGLTWEYQISVGSMFGLVEGQRAVVTNLPERDLSSRKVTPQRVDFGQQSSFSFVIGDQTGIYEFARQPAGAVDPEVLGTPSYYIKYPLETGSSWEGSTETNMLKDKVTIVTQTTVESTEEVVTVPAGTFEQCVRTTTIGEVSKDLGFMGTANITLEQHSWFCPSVGMVKSVRKEGSDHLMMGSGQISMELASFKK